jgi:hypothetical protein
MLCRDFPRFKSLSCKQNREVISYVLKVLENNQKVIEMTSVEISTLLQEMNRISSTIGLGMKLSRLEVQR